MTSICTATKILFLFKILHIIFPSPWNNRHSVIGLQGVFGYITTNKCWEHWWYMVSFIQIRLCSQNVGQVQYNCTQSWIDSAWLKKKCLSATLRKCGEKGRRRCIQEQWVWAVPSSIMNTPGRTGSEGSCQDTSFSFEVNSKGPARDTRSEAHTGVGVSLLLCAQ